MPLQVPVTQTGLEASIQQAMKNAGRNAQINLGTNSRQINALAQPLGRITGQADEFTKSMEAANARVFAFGASVGIINGVSKAFGALVKNTIEVEKSLVEINTVLNENGEKLQKFGNQLFDVAKTTGQSFDVVAKGALELARQGLGTEETLKRINDALILSRLSGLDAQQSVEGLTAAFNSFKETGITTSQILNKLVVVSQQYSVSERDLIEGLKRSASVADQAGVSFDELVGLITTVQERTARGGAVIGNAFKTIFARIQDTGALQDLSNLGIQVTDLEGKILPATKILQNLGAEFNNLSQLEQADIAKKLGGVYQLSNLLAAVKDLSSKQSKYNDIVELSASATNEAYQKNAALNETLASLINKVNVSAQQLGATLGKIGITDSLKSLLAFFNNILEGIQNILGEESALGTLFKGLAKGIGNVLAGPGLALFGAIIAKLSKDLISFGLESLKSFFKIGQSAKEIASVEKSIAAALGSNLTLQKQLFALEGNRAAQIKLMTDAIVQQEAVMRRMASTAGSLAGPLYQQGVRSTGGQGLRVPKAAGGYMPAVSQESRDISRGVGGAKAGDKPVIIPNFAFGGGKKGTMVAHTGEFIVPNFAAGGSAIFNRDMVRSMGLPAGAQKIGAAGGFIPNFAATEDEINAKIAQWRASSNTGEKALRKVLSAEKPDPIGKAAAERLLAEKEKQEGSVINAESIIGRLPVVLAPLGEASIGKMKTRRGYGKDKIDFAFSGYTTSQSGIDKLQTQFERRFSDDAIKTFAKERALLAAQQVAAAVGSEPVAPKTIEDISDKDVKGFLSSVRGAMGGIFDAAVSSALRIKAQTGVEQGDFDIRGLNAGQVEKIETLFGKKVLPPSGLADFKIGFGENTTKSMVDKTIKEYRPKIDNYIEQRDLQAGAVNKADIKTASKKAATASKGFLPNFADPLKEAIGREMSAGVPASQIYIDQNSSLKNSMNPMGLMVANRRDEPAGGMQGINRARKEGANPMTYGAASGFVPNFQRRVGTGSQPPASLGGGGGGGSSDVEQPKRDLLGVIFAVQTGLSLFTGATADATSGVGKFSNIVLEGASTFSTAMLAIQGLGSMGGKTGALVSKLGPAATTAAAGFAIIKGSLEIYRNFITDDAKNASLSLAQFSDIVNKAGVSLSSLSQEEQIKRKGAAKDLIYNLSEGSGFFGGKRVGGVGSKELQSTIAEFQFLSGIKDEGKIKDILQKGDAYGDRKLFQSSPIDEDKAGQVLSAYLKTEEAQKNITKLKQEQIKKTQDENKLSQETSLIEQINLDLIKSRLKSELDLSISKQRTLDNLDKQKISSEILNNLSEKQLDNLDYEIERRDKVRESVDSVKSLIDEQISKLSGVVGKEKESEAIREKIKNLTEEDYLNQEKVLSIVSELQAIISNNPELRKAEQDQLKETLRVLEEKRKSELDSLKTNKENTDQVKQQRDAVLSLISASNRGSVTLSSQATLGNTGQINTNQLQINRLQSQLSQPGITNAQTRGIQNQIAALETNTALLNNDNDRLRNLQEAREQAISSLPDNLKLNAEFINQINKAGDYGSVVTLLKSQSEYTDAMKSAATGIENSGLAAEQSANQNLALAQQSQNLTNIYTDIITSAQKAALAFEQIPQQIEDLDFEAMTTTSGRRLAEIAYEKETLRRQQGAGVGGAAAVARERSTKGIGQLFKEEFSTTAEEKTMNLNKSIVDASVQFRDNLIDGISQAIQEGKSLEDILTNAALQFSKELMSASIKNLVGTFTSFLPFGGGGGVKQYASGGMINGGSGTKDDVPAMLMGGEYVVNKKAVQKYGPDFLHAINNGNLSGYAKGGVVKDLPAQTGVGGFYTPGTYGQGGIQGRQNLLDFATQSATSGQYDVIRGGDNYAAISLEGESARLTTFGRTRGPQAEAIRSAKEEAFGLYQQDVEAEKQRREQEKELAKQQKDMKKQMLIQIGMAVASSVAGGIGNAGASGFKAAFGAAKSAGATGLSAFGSGIKGIFTGGNLAGVQVGGLNNLFTGVGKGLTGNFAEAGNYFKLSQISNPEQLATIAAKDKSFASFFGGMADVSGAPKAIPVGPLNNISSGIGGAPGSFRSTAYGLASIDPTTAMDQAKADRGIPGYKGFSQTVGASGRKLVPGYSVASNYFPLGTILSIGGKEYRVDDTGGMSNNVVDFFAGDDKNLYNQFANLGSINPRVVSRATGGTIPQTSGIDTIPTMLSGGEFVMNRAASQNIGTGNLQALNAGAGSLPTEEKTEELNDRLIAKLDELIATMTESANAGSVTINVDSNGKSTQETSGESSESRQKLAAQIKDTVMKVIEQEKRLGGKLRRGL